MNPEFRRNIWHELSPRRFLTMMAVLLLIFFAAALAGNDWSPAAAASLLYYFIVVLWGARNAALSVVGEVRNRTWDFQRLSSVSAADMTWGKLFGSTIFNWYGGALCLVVILAYHLSHEGLLGAVLTLIYFVVIGVIAQSAALLASLIACRRRQIHTRLEVFAYQAFGLFAAILAYEVWQFADPAASLFGHQKPAEFIEWWGVNMDARAFLLSSLALFAAWTLVGCYRAMRLELKMRNGPFVWLGFLAFAGIYVAGFDAWLPHGWVPGESDAIALRLALAASAYFLTTYAMVLLEPKDRVLYRWIGAEIGGGQFARAVGRFQGWMVAYLAAFIVSATLVGWFMHLQSSSAAAIAASAFGFLTRDVAIVVLLQTLPGPRRGDFAAVVVLFALYVLAPSILNGLDVKSALILFYPRPTSPTWLNLLVAWVEASAVVVVTLARVASTTRREVTA